MINPCKFYVMLKFKYNSIYFKVERWIKTIVTLNQYNIYDR